MKKLNLFLICFLMGATANAGNFGLGLILGDPTGLSGKYVLSKDRAIDAAMAWDLGGDFDLHIHATYLFNHYDAYEIDDVPLDVYYGPGIRMISGDGRHDRNTSLAIRGPIGTRYMFMDPDIEVFGEVALAMSIVPATRVDFDLGIGARYYF